MTAEFNTIGELFQFAEQQMPQLMFDRTLAGAGLELALKRNRIALDRYAIEQRLLTVDGAVDISTSFFGHQLACPLITAPMGTVSKIQPDGDIKMARGALRAGGLATIANERWGGAPLERIASETGGPLLAQLRCTGDLTIHEAKLEAIHQCPEYIGICMTVDGPVETRLDRFIEIAQAEETGDLLLRVPGHRFNWEEIDWIRANTDLPLGLKGVLHRDDARAAVEHGANFVWVSNHGGRKLDAVRATIDVLGEVEEEIGGQVPIIIDGGFQRGSEVLVALAKGASLVAFGKLSALALGIGQSDGVERLFTILKEELHNALACSGNVALSELNPDDVRVLEY